MVSLSAFSFSVYARARAREGCVCLFVPWPEEEVVVQQVCSRLEELGLFPCSRPTAKVRALISLKPMQAQELSHLY